MPTTLKSKRKPLKKTSRPARRSPVPANAADAAERPAWEVVVELGSQIADDEWAKVPDDSSVNFKHYLYGTPPEQP